MKILAPWFLVFLFRPYGITRQFALKSRTLGSFRSKKYLYIKSIFRDSINFTWMIVKHDTEMNMFELMSLTVGWMSWKGLKMWPIFLECAVFVVFPLRSGIVGVGVNVSNLCENITGTYIFLGVMLRSPLQNHELSTLWTQINGFFQKSSHSVSRRKKKLPRYLKKELVFDVFCIFLSLK